jgi:hypothetical protein
MKIVDEAVGEAEGEMFDEGGGEEGGWQTLPDGTKIREKK